MDSIPEAQFRLTVLAGMRSGTRSRAIMRDIGTGCGLTDTAHNDFIDLFRVEAGVRVNWIPPAYPDHWPQMSELSTHTGEGGADASNEFRVHNLFGSVIDNFFFFSSVPTPAVRA